MTRFDTVVKPNRPRSFTSRKSYTARDVREMLQDRSIYLSPIAQRHVGIRNHGDAFGFLRNVAIAMGNSRLDKFRGALERLASSADAVVADAARWGLERLR